MKNEETNQDPEFERFENRLREQPLKRVPSVWREEILRAAAVPAPRTTPHVSRFTFQELIHRLLLPHPKAWAGLGAVWVLIAGLHFSSRETSPVREARSSLPAASEMRLALRQQKLLLAELAGASLPDAERPKTVSPRPHSRRQTEIQAA
jgi:hypothetical protein